MAIIRTIGLSANRHRKLGITQELIMKRQPRGD